MRYLLSPVIIFLCALITNVTHAAEHEKRDHVAANAVQTVGKAKRNPVASNKVQAVKIVKPDTLIITRADTLIVSKPNTVIIFKPDVNAVNPDCLMAVDSVPDIEIEIDSLTTMVFKKWPIVQFVQQQPVPGKPRWTSINKPRFTWGIDVGSGVDVTGSDMSSLDVNAYFGYHGPYIRFLGVGAGIDMMISSSSNSYPMYGIFRTDFSPVPQLCFLEMRGGIAFSNIESYKRQRTPFGSIGLGITLAQGKTFSSHIILSYNYTKLNDVVVDGAEAPVHLRDLQYASLRIGVEF